MEIFTPKSLWQDFDVQAPLEVNVVKTEVLDGYKCSHVYFSGIPSGEGVVRIFAKAYFADGSRPTVLLLNDIDDDMTNQFLYLLDCGMNLVVVDYRGDKGTIYPKQPADNVGDITASKWYLWASTVMRTVTFIKSSDFCDGKVGVIGIGEGGSPVWKLSSKVTVSAAISLFSHDYLEATIHEDAEAEDILYRACLDNRAYASQLNFPMLEIISSNESDGSLDFMNEIFAGVTNDNCRISIVPRTNHSLTKKHKESVTNWFIWNFENKEIPPAPTLRPYESDGILYFEIKNAMNEPKLYYSAAKANVALRNWTECSALIKLEDSYLGRAEVFDADLPVYAFVNYETEDFIFSSPVAVRVPSAMNVVAQEAARQRLIYESSMGIDSWMVLNDVSLSGISERLLIKKGALGIEGICSLTGEMSTFKIADPRFKGSDDNLLQIMVCGNGNVIFEILDANESKYTCSREIVREKNWQTFTLNLTDFKSGGVTPLSWQSICALTVKSDEETLVATLLWV